MYIHSTTSLWNGMTQSAKSNRSELFITAFGRKTRSGGHGASDRKISYLRHTPHTEERVPYILASSPWARYWPAIRRLVSDVRAKTKAAMNLSILLPSPRTITCPVITRIDLVATSIYIEEADASWRPKAWKIREYTRRLEHSYRCRSEDTQAMIERPPKCRSVR